MNSICCDAATSPDHNQQLQSVMSTSPDQDCSISLARLMVSPLLRVTSEGGIPPALCVPFLIPMALDRVRFERDAWNSVKGVSKEEAYKQYVDKLIEVRPFYDRVSVEAPFH